MESAKRNQIYNRLKLLYGDSFNKTIISHYSSNILSEDTKDKKFKLNLYDNKEQDSIYDDAAEIHYLTDGCLEVEEFTGSSQKLQRQIEILAQKITQSIIDSREIDGE